MVPTATVDITILFRIGVIDPNIFRYAVCPSLGLGYSMSKTFLGDAIREGPNVDGLDLPAIDDGPVLKRSPSMSLVLIPISGYLFQMLGELNTLGSL